MLALGVGFFDGFLLGGPVSSLWHVRKFPR
jgi:hypothetical protein